MNIVDIIIIIFILISGVIGAKRGFFKEAVLFIGLVMVFYLAYKLKDPLGEFLILKMPFFDFPNLFKGVVTLNILVYQLVTFVVILAILLIIFNLLVSVTGLFEKILKATIILGIPSKILGFLLGLLEGYVITFVVLFFLTQPAFSFNIFMESKFGNEILTSSPILSNITNDTVEVINNVYKLKDEKDVNVLNSKILDMMLDKDIVSYDTVKKISDSKKLKFDGLEAVLDKYKEKND